MADLVEVVGVTAVEVDLIINIDLIRRSFLISIIAHYKYSTISNQVKFNIFEYPLKNIENFSSLFSKQTSFFLPNVDFVKVH